MMESLRSIYRQLLRSDGIDQAQRLPDGLAANYLKLEDHSVASQIRRLYQLSKSIRFLNPDLTYSHDWSALFKPFMNNDVPADLLPDESIENVIRRNSHDPACSLLIAFLLVLEYSKNSLNGITQKHLEFYYSEVLRFPFRPGSVDRVYVFFELNKNAPPVLISSGVILQAGKASDGKALSYRTATDIVVNQARVAAIHALFVERFREDNTFQLWSGVYDPQLLTGSVLPFGGPQSKLPSRNRTLAPAKTGLAICSSLLQLAGGERHIHVAIDSELFDDDELTFDDIKNYLQFRLTGEEDWVVPLLQDLVITYHTIGGKRTCTIEVWLLISEGMPAIIGHNGEIHKGAFPEDVPVMQFTAIPDRRVSEFFQTFKIASVSIEVEVKGLKHLIAQNEDGPQLMNKPFNLFGALPSVGSRFYLGCNECFFKNLKALDIHVQWKAPPPDFKKHYAGYAVPNSFNHAEFTASLDLLLHGTWDHPLVTQFALFDAQEDNYPLRIRLSEDEIKKANGQLELQRAEKRQDLSEGFRPGIQRGFVRLTLTGPNYDNFSAFGHSNFVTQLTSATIFKANNPEADVVIPSPPYTPQVQEISIDYKASDIIFPGANDMLFHHTPFGIKRIKDKGTSLFPFYPDLGYLYIGVAGLQPEQQINFLFKLAENSSVQFEDYASDFANPQISWSYLSDDNWIELRQDQVSIDTTKQFQQTGIVSLQTGADAGTSHTSLPSGVMWFQAGLRQGLNRVLPLSAIHTQAVEAVLDILPDEIGDYGAHLSDGLLSNRIKRSNAIGPSLKAVHQPYPSFGGVQPETLEHYITRISERLRHRNRAIHLWDFERLGLEAFQHIVRVKCIPGDEESSPGVARVVVIPKVPSTMPLVARLEPRASIFLLDQVRQFFVRHASYFATVIVSNPDYEQVLADFKVKFKTGFDPVYFMEKLNEDIIRFISPWAFNEQTSLHFDSEIYRSEVIYVIEKLPYVEYVADFKLFHLNSRGTFSSAVIGKMKIGKTFVVHKPPAPNIGGMKIGESFIVGVDWEVIIPSQNSAILVSAPRHRIKTVDDDRVCSGVSGLGIGSMTINLDFVISSST